MHNINNDTRGDIIKKYYVYGTIGILLLGTLIHFIYEWSGESRVAGVFGAVNESTWEHLKSLFWPTLLFSIIEFFIGGKKKPNFYTAKFMSLLSGIVIILVVFYTYTGIIGKPILVLDIIIFIIAVIISQMLGYKFLTSPKFVSETTNSCSLLLIFVLIALFVTFTFQPLHIPLFEDPKTGKYGI
jgi:hypothetical protein